MQLFHFGCLRERKGCLEGFPSLRFSEVTTESQIDEGEAVLQQSLTPGRGSKLPYLTAHNWTPGQGPLAICRGGRGFD